jgi:hypothetical protein
VINNAVEVEMIVEVAVIGLVGCDRFKNGLASAVREG